MKTFVYVCLLILGIVSACRISFEKRRYNKGYHVELSRKYQAADDRPAKAPEKEVSSHTTLTDAPPKKIAFKTNTESPVPTTESKKELPEQSPVSNTDHTELISSDKSVATNQNISGKAPKNVLSIAQKRNRSNNGTYWFYLIPGLTIVSIFGVFVTHKKEFLNLAKWSSRNPKKARVLIGISHLSISMFSIGVGKELYDQNLLANDHFTDFFSTTLLVSAGILFLLERRKKLLTLGSFVKQKMFHLMILGSFMGSMIVAGNRLQGQSPQQSIYGHFSGFIQQGVQKESSVKQDDNKEDRKGNSWLVLLYVFAIFITAVATFSIACGLSCQGSTLGALTVTILGTIVFGLLILALILETRRIRRDKARKKDS